MSRDPTDPTDPGTVLVLDEAAAAGREGEMGDIPSALAAIKTLRDAGKTRTGMANTLTLALGLLLADRQMQLSTRPPAIRDPAVADLDALIDAMPAILRRMIREAHRAHSSGEA